MGGWSADGYNNWSADGYPGWTADGYEPTAAPPVNPTTATILAGSFTALDLIKDALKKLTAYQSSDQLSNLDANDGLTVLNDLLDSWSNQHWAVYGSNENILYYTGGKYQYTIGNPDGGLFIGTLSLGSQVITSVTSLPSGLTINSDLAAYSSLIQTGTVVTAIGINSVVMSNASLGTKAQDQISFSAPGDFKIPRPLRITNAFTRITTMGGGYDYPIDIINQDRYVEIGLKSISYPWPTALWYNNAFPYGIINFYGAPTGGGELHLFTDTILANLELTTPISLPQGYMRALKWALASELAIEYGFPVTEALEKKVKESFKVIKDLNAVPVPEARLGLPRFRGAHTDAGGIFYGFYR